MKVFVFLLGMMTVLCGVQRAAWAQEIYPFFRDVREEGMGGAGVAVVDDDTALFVNPAGLGKIRGPSLTLANPQIETNYNTQSAMTVNGNYASLLSPQALLGMAKQSAGQNMDGMAEILPSFSTTNFAVAAYVKYDIDGLYNPSTGNLSLNYTNDDGAAVGYCFRLLSGRLKLGVMGKVINRVYVNNQNISGTSTNLSLQNLAAEGDGVGWDAGALLTGPWKYLPTLGLVAHDIGNTYFTMGNGIFYKTGVTPPPQEQMVNAALGLFPIWSNTVRSSFTAEYWNLANIDSAAWYRAFHAGVEFDVSDSLFIRGGMNELYFTAGLEFDFGHNQVQLATYGEDIGTDSNPVEDRRFIFMYGLRF